jgi:1,4-dihydroxy-2-naphthoate octaprenyltransferase
MLVSCAVGLLAMAILYMHHFPQRRGQAPRQEDPIVRLGPVGAGQLVPIPARASHLVLAYGIAVGLLPIAALLTFLSLPLAVRASQAALRTPADARRMTQAFASVFELHFTSGLLLGSLLFAG